MEGGWVVEMRGIFRNEVLFVTKKEMKVIEWDGSGNSMYSTCMMKKPLQATKYTCA